jgi:uncharacterized protein YdhG (YjbR/CyaY superfamily)
MDEQVTERIEAYLAALAPEQRSALELLRGQIAVAAPEAEDAISYGMPAFRYRGKALVGYAAASSHLSLHPMSPSVIEALATRLEPWSTSKGTIRFSPDHPLPDDLVVAIVTARIAEVEAR